MVSAEVRSVLFLVEKRKHRSHTARMTVGNAFMRFQGCDFAYKTSPSLRHTGY